MSAIQAYHCGEWIDAAALSIGIDDIGFVQGATVVERMRTFAAAPFRVDAHLARLRRSLEIVGWDADQLSRETETAIVEFVRRNAALFQPGDDWTIVALVTPGVTSDARQPTICVYGHPLPFANWARQYDSGVAAVISTVRQIPDSSWPPELKCRSRMHYYLADQEAHARQPGARAILLDQQGNVGEESTANVLAYSKQTGLFTPRVSQVLPGVSQQAVFELAPRIGISHQQLEISPQRLASADEVMLASTSICLLPVVQLDGKPIGGGQPGPIYRRLLQAWSEMVGVDVAAQAQRFAHRPAK